MWHSRRARRGKVGTVTRRTGRRPQVDAGDTRAAIQRAALEQFSERGYVAATIRSIAEDAGVDPALVMHFFGSKERLFEACVQWPFDPDEEMARVVAGGVEDAGERLVRLFVTTWDTRDGRNPVVALLRAAMDQEPAGRLLREFLQARLLMPVMVGLELDQPDVRASLVASQLIGLGAVRYVLRFDGIAGLGSDDVVAYVAPAVQRYMAGPLLRT
jgi:AcrR family transcriptional regulator